MGQTCEKQGGSYNATSDETEREAAQAVVVGCHRSAGESAVADAPELLEGG